MRKKDWNVEPNHRDASGNALLYLSSKTGKYVQLAISDQVQEILDRYEGYSPKVKSNFNELMKRVCKVAGLNRIIPYHTHTLKHKITKYEKPLHEVVASHTCRRSFATNMFNFGIPPSVIRSITGHASEQMLFNYIQLSDREIAGSLTAETLSNVFKVKP